MQVAEAYEVLNDAEKKGKYDRGEEVEPNQVPLLIVMFNYIIHSIINNIHPHDSTL